MEFKSLNDYELIYLINEGNERAYQLMIEKYTPFIIKLSKRYYRVYDEDSLYEGFEVLNEAIKKFDESYGKTFLKFYELLLSRRYISHVKRALREAEAIKAYSNLIQYNTRILEDDPRIEKLWELIGEIDDPILKEIITDYLENKAKISKLCEDKAYPKKKVYNKLYDIKTKLK